MDCDGFGVNTVVQQTFKLVEALFGDAPPSPDEPSFDELFDYASALVNGEDVAVRFPTVHQYVESTGNLDAHYQALLAVLHLERTGQLATPPASLTLGALPEPPAAALSPWRVEFGRLIINLTEQIVAAFRPAPHAVYQRSAGERTILEWAFTEESSGVVVKVTAHAAAATADNCSVMVSLGLPNRRWPHLGGIPISLIIGGESRATQLTDTFGKSVFQSVPVAMLNNTNIDIGPLVELTDAQP